jgi:hypothetical protein
LEQSFAETKTATQSALYVFRARRADWVKLICTTKSGDHVAADLSAEFT